MRAGPRTTNTMKPVHHESPDRDPDLGAVHARFARAVIFIYLGTGAVAVALLVTGLVTDLSYQREMARDTLMLETQVRAHYLGYHLRMLAGELNRLGLRSEVDLMDKNLDPERILLRLTHERSAFFNVGVAVVGPDGAVLWSEPRNFLQAGVSLAAESWYPALLRTRGVMVVPVRPEQERDSLLYVVSPILRNGQYTGMILGGVDLALEGSVGAELHPGQHDLDMVVTRQGAVIYPPKPPRFSNDAKWLDLITHAGGDPFIAEPSLATGVVLRGASGDGATSAAPRRTVIAVSPIAGTDFLLLSLADAKKFFGAAEERLGTRLGMGLALVLFPLVLLIILLRRSFKVFRQSEERALRGERLRMLGEAVNLIAHEVKNSLNGLRVGLDLLLQADKTGQTPRHGQAAAGMRSEMTRLSDFTTELLSFSRGITPRPVSLDLAEFGRKVTELARPRAESLGVSLELEFPSSRVPVRADPSLIHVAITNLVGNALDALSKDPIVGPRIRVSVQRSESEARFQVRDNGPGVSPKIRERLFEPFVTGKPSGVGIGLALSRKIARAHGGDLVLEDSDHGAHFQLLLPLEAS